MAIVLQNARPALLVEDDDFSREEAGDLWRADLTAAHATLQHAIQATGRIETDDASIPFIGTAFLVAPRIVATTDYVAKTLVDQQGDLRGEAWVNFKAEAGAETPVRHRVTQVLAMDKDASLAFIEIEAGDAGPEPIGLSTRPILEIQDTSIAVVHHSAFDARNGHDAIQQIFGDAFNVKRLSPGKILGIDAPDKVNHDASTLGGASGSPLIDLRDGTAIGLHSGGLANKHNFAIHADRLHLALRTLLGEDPSTAGGSVLTTTRASVGERSDVLAAGVSLARSAVNLDQDPPTPTSDRREIFDIDGFSQLFQDFVDAEMVHDSNLAALFALLPPEFVAAIPVSGTSAPLDKLFLRLSFLNRFLEPIGDHLPFYHVVQSAVMLNVAFPSRREKFQEHVATVLAVETEVLGG